LNQRRTGRAGISKEDLPKINKFLTHTGRRRGARWTPKGKNVLVTLKRKRTEPWRADKRTTGDE